MHNLYDRAFFEREAAFAAQGARVILPLIFEAYHPLKVMDVGCGTGAWQVEAKRLGAIAVGVDGEWARATHQDPDDFLDQDLTEGLPGVWDDAPLDLVLCLEVAEHLPASSGLILVRDMCRLAKRVLWSAAIPGQGGEGHCNERPEAYWEGVFAANGFRREEWIRDAIKGAQIPSWYTRVSIYERQT